MGTKQLQKKFADTNDTKSCKSSPTKLIHQGGDVIRLESALLNTGHLVGMCIQISLPHPLSYTFKRNYVAWPKVDCKTFKMAAKHIPCSLHVQLPVSGQPRAKGREGKIPSQHMTIERNYDCTSFDVTVYTT